MRQDMIAVRAAAAAFALGAVLAGCGGPGAEPTEAERLGYKGEDLVDQTNLTFLVTSPTTTNWVPERVVSVFEKYEFTEDELSVVEALGVLMPGESYPALPEGYAKETDEPWFAYWTRPVENFGLKGVVGVLTHFDEDRNVFETGESYFSSYWDTREDALAALAKVRAVFEEKFRVKKFHEISDGWVAEYVRLGLMGVVGQKADGKWSCMIDVRDKCRSGCGAWEPVDVQRERRARYEYTKAMKAWRVAVADVLAKNHEAVVAAMEAKGLAGFGAEAVVNDAPDGRKVKALFGQCDGAADALSLTNLIETVWGERVAEVEKAIGVKLEGDIAKQGEDGVDAWWSATGKSDLFEVRVDVAVPVVPPAPEPQPAETEDEQPPPEMRPTGQWRILFLEAFQPGMALPPRPVLKLD